MKYTKTKLEELKHIRHSARAEHRAFLQLPHPQNFSQREGILKERRDSTRKVYHRYRRAYNKYRLTKSRIKKYKKEVKRSEEKRVNESLIMCQCLDNIVVETNHSSVEEFLRNAIASYTREQPVRFEGVLPFIMAYDNSSKLYKVHEGAIEHSMNNLEMELIKMNNII
jgi:FKBP-type peptidyl-prolyl cis-trans isomerase (trigger factor)